MIYDKRKELVPVIQAILKDDEIIAGGIFQKEEYYMKKYNLTLEQIGNIQALIYLALNIKDEECNNRVNKMMKY